MGSKRWWDPLKYLKGAHYTAHFKGEGGSTSQRRPAWNADMADWVQSDVAMLDGERKEELHTLLLFRKADKFSHGRFSNWDYPDAKLSTDSTDNNYENDIFIMMFSMIRV